jgi:DNA repair exonuclease SbcCD ATPase subunit
MKIRIIEPLITPGPWEQYPAYVRANRADIKALLARNRELEISNQRQAFNKFSEFHRRLSDSQKPKGFWDGLLQSIGLLEEGGEVSFIGGGYTGDHPSQPEVVSIYDKYEHEKALRMEIAALKQTIEVLRTSKLEVLAALDRLREELHVTDSAEVGRLHKRIDELLNNAKQDQKLILDLRTEIAADDDDFAALEKETDQLRRSISNVVRQYQEQRAINHTQACALTDAWHELEKIKGAHALLQTQINPKLQAQLQSDLAEALARVAKLQQLVDSNAALVESSDKHFTAQINELISRCEKQGESIREYQRQKAIQTDEIRALKQKLSGNN